MPQPNRVALVTGGRRGIGLGIALALAKEKHDLAIAGVCDAAAAVETVSALEDLGVEALYCRADIGNAEDRERLVRATRERFGRLHVLVNNAGVAPKTRADMLDASEESFERVMRINLQGPYFLTQLVARWMLEQRVADEGFKGSIVNISSVSAEVASIDRGEYCLSKAAASMATKLWAARLGAAGISVYEIRPGIILTDMTSGVKAKYDRLIEAGLLIEPRWGSPEDIGRAVAMLARGDLPYATGQVLHLDGGLTLKRL